MPYVILFLKSINTFEKCQVFIENLLPWRIIDFSTNPHITIIHWLFFHELNAILAVRSFLVLYMHTCSGRPRRKVAQRTSAFSRAFFFFLAPGSWSTLFRLLNGFSSPTVRKYVHRTVRMRMYETKNIRSTQKSEKRAWTESAFRPTRSARPYNNRHLYTHIIILYRIISSSNRSKHCGKKNDKGL